MSLRDPSSDAHAQNLLSLLAAAQYSPWSWRSPTRLSGSFRPRVGAMSPACWVGYGIAAMLVLMSRSRCTSTGFGADRLARWHSGRPGDHRAGVVHACAAVQAWAGVRGTARSLPPVEVLSWPGWFARQSGCCCWSGWDDLGALDPTAAGV